MKSFVKVVLFLWVFCYLMSSILAGGFNPLSWVIEIKIVFSIALSVSVLVGLVWSSEVS